MVVQCDWCRNIKYRDQIIMKYFVKVNFSINFFFPVPAPSINFFLLFFKDNSVASHRCLKALAELKLHGLASWISGSQIVQRHLVTVVQRSHVAKSAVSVGIRGGGMADQVVNSFIWRQLICIWQHSNLGSQSTIYYFNKLQVSIGTFGLMWIMPNVATLGR